MNYYWVKLGSGKKGCIEAEDEAGMKAVAIFGEFARTNESLGLIPEHMEVSHFSADKGSQ